MAQVLKEDIREKILQSALEEFYEKGFTGAVMRSIAGRARIPTGLSTLIIRVKRFSLRKCSGRCATTGNLFS